MKQWTAAGLLGLIVGGTACAGPRAASAPATDAGGALRVMTFNIRYGTAPDGANAWPRRRSFVAEFLRREKPDIIGWQETLRGQLDDLHHDLPEFAELGVGRDDGKTKGEYAAILYRTDRLRAEASGTFWFCDTPDAAGTNTWERSNMRRVCTWAKLTDRTTGKPFWLFNVHLDDQSQVSREKSVDLLRTRIASTVRPLPAVHEPVVVTGDFNAGEANPATQCLKRAGWLDSYRVPHPDEKAADVGTFQGFKGVTTGVKIDYILVRPGTRVLEARIHRDHRGPLYLSDHYPVSAVIRLP